MRSASSQKATHPRVAEHGDMDTEIVRRTNDIAPGNDHFLLCRDLANAPVHLHQIVDELVAGQREGNGRELWRAAHRGNVRDIDGQRFPAEIAPGCPTGAKM